VPFRHPDPSHDLRTRIAWEVRQRIEEAVDHVCLEALVRTRQARGLPAPVADSAEDRQEYERHVAVFLERLEREVGAALTPEQQRRAPASPDAGDDESSRRLRVQVGLAQILPDYWQRFDAVRASYLVDPPTSGGERRGLLGRLLGRG
jgi:hypothetical protein